MGLRERASADLRRILEDRDSGFGWPVTLVSPDGGSWELTGFTKDVSIQIDPETGQAVTGRTASVALPIDALDELVLGGLPKAVAEASSKPWLIRWTDLRSHDWVFRIVEALPDRTLPVIVCVLERYKE